MRILIDIPDSAYKVCYDLRNVGDTNCLADILVNAVGVGTPIPDNATNGDVIKDIFPNAEYKHIKTMSGIDGMEVDGINGLYDNLGQWCARDIFFHDDWWNALYQKGGK